MSGTLTEVTGGMSSGRTCPQESFQVTLQHSGLWLLYILTWVPVNTEKLYGLVWSTFKSHSIPYAVSHKTAQI